MRYAIQRSGQQLTLVLRYSKQIQTISQPNPDPGQTALLIHECVALNCTASEDFRFLCDKVLYSI